MLVAYATRYGSTGEVAERIAACLGQAGIETQVQDVRDVHDLAGYDAVVFGTPVYLARVLRSGRRFVARHRRELADRPVAAFVVGLDTRAANERRLRRLLAKRRPAIEPVSTAFVGGVVDGQKLRFRDKTPPIRTLLPGGTDMRDWDAIDAWAAALAERLL